MPFLVFRRDHLRSTSGIIFAVWNHLQSNLGIISGLGIICGQDHLLCCTEIWTKTWQQSLSPLTEQLKTPIFENCPIMHCKLSIE